VVFPNFQSMGVSKEPVCIERFRQNLVFSSLHFRSPVHVVPPLKADFVESLSKVGKWRLLSELPRICYGFYFVMVLTNDRVESFSRSSSVVRHKGAHVESMFEGASMTVLKEDCVESVVTVCKSSSVASR
jgi:hypothetical protein